MSSVHQAARMHAQGAGSDLLMGYGSLVLILVGLHLVALIVWIGLTVFGDNKTKEVKND